MKEAINRLRSIGERGMRESDYIEVDDSLALYRQDLELVLSVHNDIARYFELYFCLSDNDMFYHKFIEMSKLENETVAECVVRLNHEMDILLQRLSRVGKAE